MPDLAQLNEPFELSARSDVDHAYMVECRGSGPVAAVQSPVLDGFGQVGNGKLVGSIKVSYRARNLEDTVVGSGGEALLLHGPLQQAFGVGTEFAVGANLACGHLRVGEDAIAGPFEAMSLAIARGEDA